MAVQGRHLHHDHHFHLERAVAGVLLAAMMCIPATARAQISVEVSPLRVELKMAAGGATPYTQSVTLTNHDAEPIRVRATVQDWYLSRDGTPQFIPADGTMPYSASSWVRVNPPEQVLAAKSTATLRFTATAPAGTAPGGYRSAIMFDFSPPGADMIAKGVAVRSRVATLVYMTVGTPKPAIELTDVQTREQRGQPPAIVATLKNTSRVHVRTRGQVFVYDSKGTQVRRLQVPEVPVLPESERDVVIPTVQQDQRPLGPGEYRVELRIDVGLPALLVGETTLTIGS